MTPTRSPPAHGLPLSGRGKPRLHFLPQQGEGRSGEAKRRRIRWGSFAIGAFALALSACGFRPLYGRYSSNPGTVATFAGIYVEPIPDRVGYELRNSLIDLLDAGDAQSGAPYHLKVTYRERIFPIAVQNQTVPIGADKTINEIITTRFNYRLEATYQLVDLKNAVITSGKDDALASYNVTASSAGAYATEMANLDAQKRAADDIANRMKLDLALYFAHHPGAPR